jgi:aldehyde:ferredoxin oxidoreductase
VPPIRPFYAIQDDQVLFHPAGSIWGTDALTANARVKADLDAPEARVVTIGQAGENQVGFALISCEYNRQAGRGGAGAVMGSKNLKAIAVTGSRLVKVHDPAAFDAACSRAAEDIAASEHARP